MLSDDSSDNTGAVTPAACRDTLQRDQAADRARPSVAYLTETYTVPIGGMNPAATLVVGLASTAMPQVGFIEAQGEIAACHSAHVADPQADGGSLAMTLGGGQLSGMPDSYPAFQAHIDIYGQARSTAFGREQTQDWVLIGHNEIEAIVSYDYTDTLPPAAARQDLTQIQIDALQAMLGSLSARPREPVGPRTSLL